MTVTRQISSAPILLSQHGILPGTGADLTARIQTVIDANPGRSILFDRPGTYLCNTTTTVSGLPWILSVRTDDTSLQGMPGAVLKTTQDAYLLMATGLFKAGTAGWANQEFVDAATYTINPASKDAVSVTTATAADAGNFAEDDWVVIRTGQVLGSGTDQPDAEVNRVGTGGGAAGTGVVPLRYPLAKPYAQEYFISGTSGNTSTTVTANPAILGIAKVTDRVVSGFTLRGLELRGENATRGLINTSQMVNYEIADNAMYCNYNMHGGGGTRFAKWLRNDIHITGDDYLWTIATDKFCGDIEIAHNRTIGRRSAPLHIHEGSYRINIHDNEFINGVAKNATDYMVSILARAYDLRIENNLMSGSGFSTGIRVDAFCDGGGVIRGNTILGSPSSGEIVILASGWEVEGNRPTNGKVNFVLGSPGVGTYRNLANGRPSMRQRVSSAWVADDFQTEMVVLLPPFSVVDSVKIQVQQLFDSSGTDTISVGTDGDNVLFATATDVSTTGIKTVTAGTGIGLYQGSALAIKAFYVNGGTEPTIGRALVEVSWHRVEAQVA